MLKNWGSWLGKENENGQVKEESDSRVDANKDNKLTNVGDTEQITTLKKQAAPLQAEQKPKSLSGKLLMSYLTLLTVFNMVIHVVVLVSAGYIYNFASSASKKLSESVIGTAETLKRSVEEGKLGEIIDKVTPS